MAEAPPRSSPGRAAGLAAIAINMGIVYGIWYSYSIILVALLREFGWSRSVLAGAFSVFTLVHGAAGPVMGMLCARLAPWRVTLWGGIALGASLWAVSLITEPWELYLSFGVVTSIAIAACGWIPSLVQVQRDFRDRLGLAMGIASAGVGVGMLALVPAFQLMIDAWGWRVAFRILAACCVAWIVPASLLLLPRGIGAQGSPAARPVAPRRGRPAQPLALREAIRTWPLWLIFGIYFLGNVCAQTLHVHQVAYLVDQGLPTLSAAAVVGIVGFASIGGKVGGGWLSDRIDRELVYIAGVLVVIASIALLAAMAGSPSRFAAWSYGVLFGFGYSVTAALVPAMVSDRFSGPDFGAIVGFGMVGGSIGAATGAWLAGRLFDATGSYALPFLIAGIAGLGAVGGAWTARRLRLAPRSAAG